MTSWRDPMQERFDVTAKSDNALQRLQSMPTAADLANKEIYYFRDYPRTTQVEASDDFGRFAAALAMLGGCVVMGRFLLAPILRRIFG